MRSQRDMRRSKELSEMKCWWPCVRPGTPSAHYQTPIYSFSVHHDASSFVLIHIARFFVLLLYLCKQTTATHNKDQ